jgi:hypothetical protein
MTAVWWRTGIKGVERPATERGRALTPAITYA